MIFKVGDRVRVTKSSFGMEGAEGEVVAGNDRDERFVVGVEFPESVTKRANLAFHSCSDHGEMGRCWYVHKECLEMTSPQLELFNQEERRP